MLIEFQNMDDVCVSVCPYCNLKAEIFSSLLQQHVQYW